MVAPATRTMARLSELLPGERGLVHQLLCRGLLRRRFYDLGIVPGTPVDVLRRSPVGDPTAFRIRGATLALRSAETDQIMVEQLGN